MKKIILALLIQFTILSADYVINPDGTLTPQTTQSTTTPPAADTWVEAPLPTEAFNVLDYGLKGDGVTDDSVALKELAKNTDVTNWYFPSGHTFRLASVGIPSHVEAVFGAGTLKTISAETGAPISPPCLAVSVMPDTSLVIDGITFTYDSEWNEGVSDTYGAFVINKYNVHNVELRNCIFQGVSTNPMNGILLSGKIENGGIKNIYIHDNKFYNITRAAIEITKRDEVGNNESLGVDEVHVYNNTFDCSGLSDGWRCAVSWSQMRGYGTTYNNIFTNNRWDIELDDTKGVIVRNNYSTGCTEHFMSISSKNYDYKTAISYVYDNHWESDVANIHIINGTAVEFYHNYVKGQIHHSRGEGGHIYENTIVRPSDLNIHDHDFGVFLAQFDGASENKVTFEDNDIYDEHASRLASIYIHTDADSETIVQNNNVYMSSSKSCISIGTNAITSGNTCNQNYLGSIPSSRPSAGLLP